MLASKRQVGIKHECGPLEPGSATRPIFHKLDETIRGHVFCSFLALVLKKALEDRLAAFGRSGSWP